MDIDGDSSGSSDDEMAEMLMINMVYDYYQDYLNKTAVHDSKLSGREFVNETLNGSGTVCFDLFRMRKPCFVRFCNELKEKNYLSDSRDVFVEEKVAMFLFIIGHSVRHRVVANRFQHSTETVSRYFKEVLRAVCRLGKELIRPDSTELPDSIKSNHKYYPWFKNCIGAIDGIHISAWVPADKQMSCRGRKTTITQNVMFVCDFNMMFTYVYSGWEGSAHDAKVFLDALTNPNAEFPWPPRGHFYLVDSGYSCTGGFLPPFRGERQRLIVTTCAIHNYIRKWNLNDELFRMWEELDPAEFDSMNEGPSTAGTTSHDDNLARLSDEGAAEMAMQRDQIADSMWAHHDIDN
ncbi:uncharacterized protein LOC130719617 [Lotus japonicus]|uniref:uncharacterized protein LOC130719617 n=1 Tax=Lotus japonicus TaxID=34305 RepID=UPI00258FBE77|nr:uncharacterized protein LOC130719617 [Lotus japonicus]